MQILLFYISTLLLSSAKSILIIHRQSEKVNRSALLIADLLYDSAFLTLENKNIEIIKWSKLSFTPLYYFFLRCNISVNSTSFFLRATVSLRNVLGVVPLIFLKNLQKFCDEDRPILEAICSPSSSVKRR